MDKCECGCGCAPAAGETWVVASTSGVSVRKTADPGSGVLGALGLGSEITVTQQVRSGEDFRGYVSASKPGEGTWGKTEGWVNLLPCCKGTPSKWVVTASSLNVRREPDANSARINSLPTNTKVTVTTIKKGGDYTWGFVAYAKKPNNEYHMRDGWVALEHCKKA